MAEAFGSSPRGRLEKDAIKKVICTKSNWGLVEEAGDRSEVSVELPTDDEGNDMEDEGDVEDESDVEDEEA